MAAGDPGCQKVEPATLQKSSFNGKGFNLQFHAFSFEDISHPF